MTYKYGQIVNKRGTEFEQILLPSAGQHIQRFWAEPRKHGMQRPGQAQNSKQIQHTSQPIDECGRRSRVYHVHQIADRMQEVLEQWLMQSVHKERQMIDFSVTQELRSRQ